MIAYKGGNCNGFWKKEWLFDALLQASLDPGALVCYNGGEENAGKEQAHGKKDQNTQGALVGAG